MDDSSTVRRIMKGSVKIEEKCGHSFESSRQELLNSLEQVLFSQNFPHLLILTADKI